MYDEGFRVKGNIGNNSFSYDIRKENNPDPKIYVTNLIEGNINDIQIGDKIAFEEVNSKGKIESFVGLKYFVKFSFNRHSGARPLRSQRVMGLQPESTNIDQIPIYILDNHNHALYFRYQEYFNGNIAKGNKLIHIDQHTDMNQNSEGIIKNAELQDIFHFTNYQCNVGNFIQPAIQEGLISQVTQINTEYTLLNHGGTESLKYGNFILDIDLDFWHPEMGIEQHKKTIEITKNLISQASVVTIATSPYFLDQILAIKILKDIFSN